MYWLISIINGKETCANGRGLVTEKKNMYLFKQNVRSNKGFFRKKRLQIISLAVTFLSLASEGTYVAHIT